MTLNAQQRLAESTVAWLLPIWLTTALGGVTPNAHASVVCTGAPCEIVSNAETRHTEILARGENGRPGDAGRLWIGSGAPGRDGQDGADVTMDPEVMAGSVTARPGLVVDAGGGHGGAGGYSLFAAQGIGGSGGHGGNIVLKPGTPRHDAGAGEPFVGISLASAGGAGGKGAGGGQGGLRAVQAGSGGNIVATLEGTTIRAAGIALRVVSRGGDGGEESSGWPARGSGARDGGRAGHVRVVASGEYRSDNEAAIRIESVGGNTASGKGGAAGSARLVVGRPDVSGTAVSTGGGNAEGVYVGNRGGSATKRGAGGEAVARSGFASGDGHDLEDAAAIIDNALIVTTGGDSVGVRVESLGGAGKAYSGGSAGKVHAALNGRSRVRTSGERSHGVHAQSVGGRSEGEDALYVGAGFGAVWDGKNGAGGHGGAIDVSLDVDGSAATEKNARRDAGVFTEGDFADAILAQSIGGGGGGGGKYSVLATGFSLAFGVNGESGGHGGPISIHSHGGRIRTEGTGSAAVRAQSVGGGGGGGSHATGLNGGIPLVVASFSMAVAVGGKAGEGGDGGRVTLFNDADIGTQGDSAPGVDLQSIGGGGGQGGTTTAGSLAMSYGASVSATVGLGASGGKGGSGGEIKLANRGFVETSGEQSPGLVVQSVGGGGGKGGAGVSVASSKGSRSFALVFKAGGSGRAGGDGGALALSNGGMLATAGALSRGVIAQSVGGGGGMAAGGEGGAMADEISATVALGSDEGASGHGGAIEIVNEAAGVIETSGRDADGIFAQSVGGGGGVVDLLGRGAESEAVDPMERELEKLNTWSVPPISLVQEPAEQPVRPSYSVKAGFEIGGKSGNGGHGGGVTVKNEGRIATRGKGASGVFAQSIGGGGGKATASGFNASIGGAMVSAMMGGSGGASGHGGRIDVVNSGMITTRGERAYAIFAQSAGGGGGSMTMLNSIFEGSRLSANFVLGGSGGSAGDGNTVTVANTGTIATHGSTAVSAQSIGGGGGDSAPSKAGMIVSRNKSAEVTIAIGGSGGGGGNGGNVAFTNGGAASITTRGDQADAVHLQSIGAGGGNGGAAATHAVAEMKDVGEMSPFEIFTIFDTARHAVGPAPENERAAPDGPPDWRRLSVALGGRGGVSGDGGKVTATLEAGTLLATHGDQAMGMVAQSIGAGGGKAVVSVSNPLRGVLPMVFGLGGTGGAAGRGGPVRIASAGDIRTHGARSHGMLVQSIGGGGGAVLVEDGWFDGTTSVGLKAEKSRAGDGNDGGPVEVEHTGSIRTTGAGAYGILAQSIGGGGGYAADTAAIALGAERPAASGRAEASEQGSGGDVLITVGPSARIETAGENAAAIFAQSVGGGGGLSNGMAGAGGADATGAGGSVEVAVDGMVGASGKNAVGIFVQSAKGGARQERFGWAGADAQPGSTGDSVVRIGRSGIVHGGIGEHAAGVVLGGGATRQRVDIEEGGTLYGLNGKAVLAVDRTTPSFVNNGGLLIGDVVLGGGRLNKLANLPTGVFESGALVDVGTGNVFENHGVFSPGGRGRHMTTRIIGDYRQMGHGSGATQGVYEPDVDFREGKADLAIVQGHVALDGIVRPQGRYQLPHRRIAILRAQGRGHGIRMEETLRMDNPLVYTYTLEKAGDARLDVGVTADFTKPRGLSEEQASLAASMQRNWDTMPAEQLRDYAEVFDHFANVRTEEEYRRALTELANDAQQVSASVLPGKSRSFIQLMMSCPEFRSDDASQQEGSCYWGRILSNVSRLKSSDRREGFHGNGATYQIGGQKEFAPGWILGASAAYENSRHDASDTPVRTDGGLFSGGVVLKRRQGAWLFAGALNAGYGTYDTRRVLALAAGDRVAESRWRSGHVGMRLRASYVHALSDWYLKPLFDVDLVYQRVPGYGETGAGAFNLHFQDASRWNATLTPALEIGGRVDLQGGVLRPYLSVGVSWMSDSAWVVDGRLQSDPSKESFRLRTSLPKVMGEVKTGVELVSAEGYEIKAEYDLRFAKGYVSRTGILRMAVHF